jgi:hypothetical protein
MEMSEIYNVGYIGYIGYILILTLIIIIATRRFLYIALIRSISSLATAFSNSMRNLKEILKLFFSKAKPMGLKEKMKPNAETNDTKLSTPEQDKSKPFKLYTLVPKRTTIISITLCIIFSTYIKQASGTELIWPKLFIMGLVLGIGTWIIRQTLANLDKTKVDKNKEDINIKKEDTGNIKNVKDLTIFQKVVLQTITYLKFLPLRMLTILIVIAAVQIGGLYIITILKIILIIHFESFNALYFGLVIDNVNWPNTKIILENLIDLLPLIPVLIGRSVGSFSIKTIFIISKDSSFWIAITRVLTKFYNALVKIIKNIKKK